MQHVFLALTAVCCLGVAMWAMNGGERQPTKSLDAAEQSSSSTPTAATSPKEEDLQKERVALNHRVRAFTAVYFSLSPAKSNTEMRAEIAPYATENFMQSARIGYGTSAADQAMLREGSELKAKALGGLDGHFDSVNRAFGTVEMHIIKYDRDGNVVMSYNRTQSMTWVRQGSTWLIDDMPIT